MKDAALVHGYGVNPDGSLSVCARNRVDGAIRLYRQGRVRKLLMTGGKGEAAALKRYAVSRGVAEADILVEELSRSTVENVWMAERLILRPRGYASVYLVSSYWHGRRIADVLAPTYLAGYDWKFVPTPDGRPAQEIERSVRLERVKYVQDKLLTAIPGIRRRPDVATTTVKRLVRRLNSLWPKV